MGFHSGLVWGPLLWNLVYDTILRVELLPDVHIVFYVDDTLVFVEREDFEGHHHHSGRDQDSAQQTLEDWLSWGSER